MGVIVARVLIMIVFGGGGVVLLYIGVTQFLQQRQLLRNATSVDAEIIQSYVSTSESSSVGGKPLENRATTTHRPHVRFRYRVQGLEYESELLRPTIIVTTYPSHGAAEADLVPFPLGAIVHAKVDPSHPDKAYLVAESSLAPIGFIVVGLLLPPVAWFAGKLV